MHNLMQRDNLMVHNSDKIIDLGIATGLTWVATEKWDTMIWKPTGCNEYREDH